MTTAPGVEALRTLLPPDRIRGIEEYAIDGALPALAVRPANREEAARVIAAADDAGLVVVPLGARTQTGLGRPLARYDVALDTTALTRLVHYEPNDLTITVEAGMTLAELQRTLAANGQYLPADPPPSDAVTIGGLLATARPGAWRHHMPGQRDLVLGITSVQPDGTLTHSGGRVVKNVSGYDLHRMHTGALGAFGVIVEATFKLAPAPTATRTLGVECESLAHAAEVATGLWDLALPLRALTLLTPTAAEAVGLPRSAMVLLEAFGNDAVLARVGEAVRQAAMAARSPRAGALPDEAWTKLRALAGDPGQVVLRLGAPSSKVAEVAQAAAEAGCAVWAHLAAGSILAVAPDLTADTVRTLREAARARGGFLQIESAPSALRREVDPFDLTERTLVAALKREFDPRGTLNRGRWQEDV
jgi:glycolate oxidase FAD binding subunit